MKKVLAELAIFAGIFAILFITISVSLGRLIHVPTRKPTEVVAAVDLEVKKNRAILRLPGRLVIDVRGEAERQRILLNSNLVLPSDVPLGISLNEIISKTRISQAVVIFYSGESVIKAQAWKRMLGGFNYTVIALEVNEETVKTFSELTLPAT